MNRYRIIYLLITAVSITCACSLLTEDIATDSNNAQADVMEKDETRSSVN